MDKRILGLICVSCLLLGIETRSTVPEENGKLLLLTVTGNITNYIVNVRFRSKTTCFERMTRAVFNRERVTLP